MPSRTVVGVTTTSHQPVINIPKHLTSYNWPLVVRTKSPHITAHDHISDRETIIIDEHPRDVITTWRESKAVAIPRCSSSSWEQKPLSYPSYTNDIHIHNNIYNSHQHDTHYHSHHHHPHYHRWHPHSYHSHDHYHHRHHNTHHGGNGPTWNYAGYRYFPAITTVPDSAPEAGLDIEWRHESPHYWKYASLHCKDDEEWYTESWY